MPQRLALRHCRRRHRLRSSLERSSSAEPARTHVNAASRTTTNFICRAPPASSPARAGTAAMLRAIFRQIHRRLAILQLVDRLLQLFLVLQQRCFSGSFACAATAPRCSTAKCPAISPSPFSGDGVFTPSPFAGVFDQRMLGRQALLRFEEFRGLGFRVPERFERGDRLRSYPYRRPDRAAPRSSSARNTVAFFSVPVLVAVMTTRLGLPSAISDPPLELVILTTSCASPESCPADSPSSVAVISGPGRLNL